MHGATIRLLLRVMKSAYIKCANMLTLLRDERKIPS